MSRLGYKFREAFKVHELDFTSWFPEHMQKGMIKMRRKLKTVDCVIEVCDARLPFSGRNPEFRKNLTPVKPHILLLNKMDLADLTHMDLVAARLRREGVNEVIYTNFTKPSNMGLKMVIPTIQKILNTTDRFNRNMEEDFSLMVIGIPNIGKSTLINVLRTMYLYNKRNATVEGKYPGVTRSVMEKIRVCEEPRIYITDCPGVMDPHIEDKETALKLALCGAIKEDWIGFEILADYMLYWLNKNEKFKYVQVLNLPQPVDDIYYVLTHTAAQLGKRRYIKGITGSAELCLDLHAAAAFMLRNFRDGSFGKFCLDSDLLPAVVTGSSTLH